ncbi:MAG TPA: gamma-glutamyl-gamma-aminobutyrate hydrolase family protein [Solirubrobacteraceae bacterium]|nr:gamma-glutamyl-gamma-aminobutyrate hydrolase family protein [Solirubrobacteraceae bacterium]
MRALVIQHDDDGPAGHVGDWLQERGAEQDLYRIGDDDRDRYPRDYDLIVSLGSEHTAYDDSIPWLGTERRLLAEAAAADVAVLGICFGAQLLARALGGEAMRAAQPEIGWVSIDSREPSLVQAGPWMQWHYDTFTLPPGAVQLAASPVGPQAFTLGRSLGVQFHPEVTPEIVASWVDAGRAQLARAGLDPDRVMAETRGLADENRLRAWQLLDTFMDRVAGVGAA